MTFGSGTCAYCGTPLAQPAGGGRPRRFCSNAHRVAAQGRRQQGLPEEVVGAEPLTVRETRAEPLSGANGRDMLPVLTSPVLIDRDAEVASILSLAVRPPGMVVVEGEPGVGKSRLLETVLARPELREARRIIGHAHPVRDPFPLGPMVEALRSVTILPGGNVFSPSVGVLGRLVPELAPRLPPPPPPSGDPRTDRHILFRTVLEVLAQLGPTVCVLEDLHWADEATIELLAFLAAQPPANLVLVLSFRREDLAAASPLLSVADRAARHVPVCRIELGPLLVEGVRRLVQALLRTDDVSMEFAAYVHERTAGVPFAVEEVIRLMQDRRGLVRFGGYRARRELDGLAVPATIRDAILERTARLGADARAVVEAVAVAGTPVTSQFLRRMTKITSAALARALREALASAMLVETQPDRYQLRRVLATQAVYESIPRIERERLHLLAAQVLEKEVPKPVGLLAHHYREARQMTQWLHYAEDAAELASQHDNATAAHLLLDALLSADIPVADRARLCIKLARASLRAHAHQPEAIAQLRQVIEDATLEVPVRGHVRSLLGLLLIETGEGSAGYHEQAQSVDELATRPELAAIVMGNLALPGTVDREQRECLRWLARAEQAARRQRDPGVRLTTATVAALAPVYFGDPAALPAVDALPRSVGSRAERIQLLWLSAHLASACLYLGHYERSRAFLDEAVAAGLELGWERFTPLLEGTRILLDWAAGHWQGLEARALRCIEGLAVDFPPAAQMAGYVAASIFQAQGRVEDAEERYESLVAAAAAAGVLPILAAAAGGAARTHLDRGDVEGARHWAHVGVDAISATGIWVWAGELAPAAVEALLAAGDEDGARRLVDALETGVRERDAPLTHAALLHCRALFDEALIADAASAYQTLPRPYDAARIQARRAGQMVALGNGDGVITMSAAVDVFESLGAGADAARARRVLRVHGIRAGRPRGSGRGRYDNDLSPRELRVAELAAQGLSNAEIATRLFISVKTAEHQVAAAMRKLDVRSRSALGRRLTTAPGPPS